MKQLLKIKPIGGLEKIGSNITLVETNGIVIAIDCGLRFYHEDCFNVNYLFPDLSSVEKIDYLLITHGHEDHIGGIFPFISQFPNTKVFASGFAASLINKKLSYRSINIDIKPLSELSKIVKKETSLNLEFLPVNHSIPETYGVHFYNKDVSLLFISDFKIDEIPGEEVKLDLNNYPNITKKRKVKIAMLDSTNILVPKRRVKEKDVVENIEKAIGTFNKRIYITTFASNLYRVKKIFEFCEIFKRKIILRGPSIKKYLDTGIKSGLINEQVVSSRLLNEKTSKVPENAVFLVAGCQGDRKSSLSNLVNTPDSKFFPRENDLFIFSSKAIPGNEAKISYIIDELIRAGVHVVGDWEGFHSSGHADQEDLIDMYKKFSPTHAIPIHGTVNFLHRHAELIEKNFTSINVIPSLNFDEIHLTNNLEVVPKKTNSSPAPRFISGPLEIDLDKSVLSEKRKIAESGVVSYVINNKGGSLNLVSFELIGVPELFPEDEEELFNSFSSNQTLSKNHDQEIRSISNKFFRNTFGYAPKVIYHLI